MSIEAEYVRRKATADSAFRRWKSYGDKVGVVVAILMVFAGRALWMVIGTAGSWTPSLMACGGTLAVVVGWRWLRRKEWQAARVSRWYETGLDRLQGGVGQDAPTGQSFAPEGHLYAFDLDVVGANSLFSRLATTRTALGQRGLAKLLLETVTAEEARQRQVSVKELTPALDLREQVALLGRSKFEEIPAESYERWLEVESAETAKWFRPLLMVVTASWIVLIVVGWLAYGQPFVFLRGVAVLLVAQGVLCNWVRAGVRVEMVAAKSLPGQTAILRRGLSLLRAAEFKSERLQAIQAECRGYEVALTRLERWLAVVEHRDKEWFAILNLLLCGGTYAALGLRGWKRQNAEPMRRWIAAWSEFEGLLAVATYAAEHPEDVYPEILDEGALLQATEMAHPLLAREQAVANDVVLGGEVRFLLISGSNMAGKSTLLRTVGTNVVLALAGAPVRARTMTMSALQLGASLAVRDSLAEGRSKFLAEVERLRDVLEMARAHPSQSLFLIDEVLSGTNSADRRVAAAAVVQGLIKAGAIGALSTHDLALSVLAESEELGGRNVHMASPDEDDPLRFDYLLKPGVNTTTNAMAIVRLLGLSD